MGCDCCRHRRGRTSVYECCTSVYKSSRELARVCGLSEPRLLGIQGWAAVAVGTGVVGRVFACVVREFTSVFRLYVQSRIRSGYVGWISLWLYCRSSSCVCRPVSGAGSWIGLPQEGVHERKTHGDYLIDFLASWHGRTAGRCSRGFGGANVSYPVTVLSCKESVDGQIISVTY